MAETPARVEQTQATDVLAAVERLRSADSWTLPQIECYALRLPRDAFAATVRTLRARCESGSVANDAGLLVHLLKVELRKQAQARAELQAAAVGAVEQPAGVIERIKREDPEQYVRAMANVPGFDVVEYLERYVLDAAERRRLYELVERREAA